MKTSRSRREKRASHLAAFWDTSAIAPLCTMQPQSAPARQAASVHSRQVVWWATPVEATSAFCRLARESVINPKDLRQALARLEYLRVRWNEIQPTEDLRLRAERLLTAHKLRAADAMQLAAAMVWCGNHTRGRIFIAADGSLADAADAEGFTILRIL